MKKRTNKKPETPETPAEPVVEAAPVPPPSPAYQAYDTEVRKLTGFAVGQILWSEDYRNFLDGTVWARLGDDVVVRIGEGSELKDFVRMNERKSKALWDKNEAVRVRVETEARVFAARKKRPRGVGYSPYLDRG